MDWNGDERRFTPALSAEQIDVIAERAAEKAIEKVYTQIGKWTVQRFLFVVGAATLAVLAWLGGRGLIK